MAEYWLLDPWREWAEFYWLDDKGSTLPFFLDARGVYRSRVITGFWLQVEWLWQTPLPLIEDVLLEIGGETYAQRRLARLHEHGFLP